MKHDDSIKKRIEHHKKMIELLSKHNSKDLDAPRKKNVEKAYKILEGYEFVLKKKGKK